MFLLPPLGMYLCRQCMLFAGVNIHAELNIRIKRRLNYGILCCLVRICICMYVLCHQSAYMYALDEWMDGRMDGWMNGWMDG